MKKKLFKTVIISLTAIGLGILIFGIVVLFFNDKSYYEEDYEEDIEVFDTEWYRPSSLLVFISNGNRGYRSAETGEVVVDAIFKRAWVDDTISGLAACVNKESKMGFISAKTGDTVIPFKFDFDDSYFMQRDYYYMTEYPRFDFIFRNGLCLIPAKGGKIGIINTAGEVLLEPDYVDIINWMDPKEPYIILKKKADKDSDYQYVYGVCDRNFNMVLDFDYNVFEKNYEYEYDEDNEDWRICLKSYIVAKEDKYGVIDGSFKTIIPLMYDYVVPSYYSTDIYLTSLDEKKGLFNTSTKKWILPIEYEYIKIRYDGTILAENDDFQKLYDENGKVICHCYIENSDCEEVFTPIISPGGLETPYIRYRLNGLYGIINSKQQVLIPAKHEEIYYLGNQNFACSDEEYTFIINVKQ